MVYIAIAVGRSTTSPGSHGAALGGSSGMRRVIATWMPSSGASDDTDQSLPAVTTAPVRATLPIGYNHRERARPSAGSARTVTYSSPLAQKGSKFATTPRRRNRGMSAGSMSCRWVIVWRASRRPFASRARGEGVERHANRPVPDRVDVKLPPIAIQRDRQAVERGLVVDRLAGIALTVEVRGEQRRGSGLDDAVLEQLGRDRPDQARGVPGPPAGDSPGDARDAGGVGLRVHRCHDADHESLRPVGLGVGAEQALIREPFHHARDARRVGQPLGPLQTLAQLGIGALGEQARHRARWRSPAASRSARRSLGRARSGRPPDRPSRA